MLNKSNKRVFESTKAADWLMFRYVDRLCRPLWLPVVLIGLLSFIGSALVTISSGPLSPSVHDEFAYLLAADTFAKGRVTNPTHPMWVHFETFHVIHNPTYCAKYPPGQGLFLALGQVIGGHPAVGVWLSSGLMCAAICWMLQAWLPLRWALLGSFLATLKIGIVGDWATGYWGGTVAAFGGALLYGSLRRILRKPHFVDGLLMGAGLALLANSRPLEGALFSVPAIAALVYALVGRAKPSSSDVFLKAAVPTALVLITTAFAMGYYNWRCTGNPIRMAYQVHEATYAIAPIFTWQKPRPTPTYRHREIEKFHKEFFLDRFNETKTFTGFASEIYRTLKTIWWHYLGPVLGCVLLVIPLILSDRWMLLAISAMSLTFVAMLLTPFHFAHYSAPLAGLLYCVLTQGLRCLSLFQVRSRAVGRTLIHVVVSISILYVSLPIGNRLAKSYQPGFRQNRHDIVGQLKNKMGRHLVIVRYGPNHNVHKEWVYNEADIDAAKIVWARDMGKQMNQELFEYFNDRAVWLLLVDNESMKPTLKLYNDD